VFSDPQLLGDPRCFRSCFAERLVQFELRRVASGERVAIAREMLMQAQEQLRFISDRADEPLVEHLARPAEPLQYVLQPAFPRLFNHVAPGAAEGSERPIGMQRKPGPKSPKRRHAFSRGYSPRFSPAFFRM
jgi:hypothetical protein